MEAGNAGGPRWRVGLGGMSCECCTFTAATSGADDFVVLRGEALRDAYGSLGAAPGAAAGAAAGSGRGDVEYVPLLRARALPGGSVDRAFYDATKRELLDALAAAAPLDGLLLPMHGALHVRGLEDAEGDLLAAIRDVVGPVCRIAASYDLHGNLSPAVMRAIDVLTAYRTAPHVDVDETVARAAAALLEVLRRGRRPATAFVPVPILLPGEKTSTHWEPGASLYAALPTLVDRHGLLDASLLMGYPWADERRSGASVVAVAWEADAASSAAEELAQRLWDGRGRFAFGVEAAPVDECLHAAAATEVRPVVVSDSGDNPTAGGAGDVPYVLARMLALGATDALYASLADSAAVAACRRAGKGTAIELPLGGRTDPRHGAPLRVRAEVLSVHDTTLAVGTGAGLPNATVVLRVDGVRVIVTERRTPFHRLDDFLRLGIDPRELRLVVVKIGYLEPELEAMAARSLLALSPGAVDQDLAALAYRRVRRPMFPLDPDFDWSPGAEVFP